MEMSLHNRGSSSGSTPLIRTVIVRCELAALLTVQQAARVFLCVVHTINLLAVSQLAGRLPIGADAEGNPISPRRASAQFRGASLLGERGMRLISANQMDIETDRPPNFSL